MTPDEAKESLNRFLSDEGEVVTFTQKVGGNDSDGTLVRVTGYAPDELIGDVRQGDRKIIARAEGMSFTPQRGDKVEVRGKTLNVEFCDDNTRRIQGVLIALEIRARG